MCPLTIFVVFFLALWLGWSSKTRILLSIDDTAGPRRPNIRVLASIEAMHQMEVGCKCLDCGYVCGVNGYYPPEINNVLAFGLYEFSPFQNRWRVRKLLIRGFHLRHDRRVMLITRNINDWISGYRCYNLKWRWKSKSGEVTLPVPIAETRFIGRGPTPQVIGCINNAGLNTSQNTLDANIRGKLAKEVFPDGRKVPNPDLNSQAMCQNFVVGICKGAPAFKPATEGRKSLAGGLGRRPPECDRLSKGVTQCHPVPPSFIIMRGDGKSIYALARGSLEAWATIGQPGQARVSDACTVTDACAKGASDIALTAAIGYALDIRDRCSTGGTEVATAGHAAARESRVAGVHRGVIRSRAVEHSGGDQWEVVVVRKRLRRPSQRSLSAVYGRGANMARELPYVAHVIRAESQRLLAD
ncbi:hypothetical protein B0H10DRAFT_1962972 [Mycena sp. CBHHK59/15]|nr:hypothetical protein B0H10DRAFT_1962972 [Mycena sp. CBHHK59/15]